MNNKTLKIVSFSAAVIGAACAVIGKVVYDKVKQRAKKDLEEEKVNSLGALNNSDLESYGVGANSASNNDYPRTTTTPEE